MNCKSILLTSLGVSALAVAEAQQPNVVVFLIDDMGVMDTSVPFLTDANGKPQVHPLNEWYRTPNMGKLAQMGVRFSSFRAQSVSSPSRASLLTGQNSARHRTTNWIDPAANNRNTYGPMAWNWKGLDPANPLLPKLMKEAGYRTIHVGKAHFGPAGSVAEDPSNLGFDVNIGGCGIGHPGSYYGEDGYGNLKGQKSHAVPHLEKYHSTETFLTEALTLEANAEISKSVQQGRPFFLYMAHYAVHSPFQPDKRFIDHYENSGKGKAAEAYASLIEGMDKSLGDLMAHLEKEGVAQNTVVIFLGDNGGDAPLGDENGHFSSAPLRGKKGSVYEGGTRVPFLMSWVKPEDNILQKRFPIQSGGIQNQPAGVMDIYPTILEMSGVKPVKGFVVDGVSLSMQMKGKVNRKRSDEVLMHFPHQHRGSYFTTFIDGDWKLIYHYRPEDPQNPKYELFNLKGDPFEDKDLSVLELKKLVQMVEGMQKALQREGALYPVDKDGKDVLPLIPGC